MISSPSFLPPSSSPFIVFLASIAETVIILAVTSAEDMADRIAARCGQRIQGSDSGIAGAIHGGHGD